MPSTGVQYLIINALETLDLLIWRIYDYMTDEERQEALAIARSLFNDKYIKSYLENKRQNNLQPQINS
jgi:sensor histidine kinase regulating citrate/malate metabolism